MKDDSKKVHYIGSLQMQLDRARLQITKWSDRFMKIIAQHFATQEFHMSPPKLHGLVHIGLLELHGRIRIDLPELHGWIHISLPELHRRFRIDPPKWFIRFRIVPPQVSHSIWSHQISTVGDFFGTMSIMQEKQQKIVFEIECAIFARLVKLYTYILYSTGVKVVVNTTVGQLGAV